MQDFVEGRNMFFVTPGCQLELLKATFKIVFIYTHYYIYLYFRALLVKNMSQKFFPMFYYFEATEHDLELGSSKLVLKCKAQRTEEVIITKEVITMEYTSNKHPLWDE